MLMTQNNVRLNDHGCVVSKENQWQRLQRSPWQGTLTMLMTPTQDKTAREKLHTAEQYPEFLHMPLSYAEKNIVDQQFDTCLPNALPTQSLEASLASSFPVPRLGTHH